MNLEACRQAGELYGRLIEGLVVGELDMRSLRDKMMYRWSFYFDGRSFACTWCESMTILSQINTELLALRICEDWLREYKKITERDEKD